MSCVNLGAALLSGHRIRLQVSSRTCPARPQRNIGGDIASETAEDYTPAVTVSPRRLASVALDPSGHRVVTAATAWKMRKRLGPGLACGVTAVDAEGADHLVSTRADIQRASWQTRSQRPPPRSVQIPT
jgi:hypothetical protein